MEKRAHPENEWEFVVLDISAIAHLALVISPAVIQVNLEPKLDPPKAERLLRTVFTLKVDNIMNRVAPGHIYRSIPCLS